MSKSLPQRLRGILDVAPADWKPRDPKHDLGYLRQLEHRHLVELRPIGLGGWEWRRWPEKTEQ